MGKLSIVLAVTVLAVASCATNQEKDTAESRANQEGDKEAGAPILVPPKPLEDTWSRWLIGQWDCSAESDIPGFKKWVRGTGQMTAELSLGGQFLLTRMQGKMTHLSEEYIEYLRQTLHAPDEDIQRLQNMTFGSLELRSIDPQTGRISAHLFDSWRCTAQGTGIRKGNTEILEWKWSLAGAGTSVRVTEKVADDKMVVVERYILPDGSTMEDRAVMVRRQSVPADSGDLALLTTR
jgi:hypothetical protein